MIFSKLKKDRGSALGIADKLGLICLGQFILICILITSVFGSHDRIVLTPMKLDKRASISYDAASKEYHEKYGLSLTSLIGNINPNTSISVIKALQSSFSPALYSRLKTKLEEEADKIKQAGLSVSFTPEKWEFEPATNLTFVSGVQMTIPLNGEPREKKVTYEYKLLVDQYIPIIQHFDFYPGNAHTLKWKEKNRIVSTGDQ